MRNSAPIDIRLSQSHFETSQYNVLFPFICGINSSQTHFESVMKLVSSLRKLEISKISISFIANKTLVWKHYKIKLFKALTSAI